MNSRLFKSSEIADELAINGEVIHKGPYNFVFLNGISRLHPIVHLVLLNLEWTSKLSPCNLIKPIAASWSIASVIDMPTFYQNLWFLSHDLSASFICSLTLQSHWQPWVFIISNQGLCKWTKLTKHYKWDHNSFMIGFGNELLSQAFVLNFLWATCGHCTWHS